MTCREIQDRLSYLHWDTRRHILVPNVSHGLLSWEADLVVMYPSGWLDEVEVKISKSDFRREFASKRWKHGELRCGGSSGSYGRGSIIRKYWMAMPLGLADSVLGEVPAYAGVIAVGSRCQVLKPATPLKCCRKLTDAEQKQLLRLAYLRYWDLRRRQPTPTIEETT